MRNIVFLVICLIQVSTLFSQDRFVTDDMASMNVNITRMHYDTIFYTAGEKEIFITFDQFEKLDTRDPFKKYLFIDPTIYDSDNIPLAYTNYCIGRYSNQSNIGRTMMLAGALVSIGSVAMGNDDFMMIGGIAGGVISLAGYIVEWNSLHWLNNLQLTGEYKIGLGWVFNF